MSTIQPPDPRFPETDPFPPREIWVLGAGKFGAQAARRLHRRHPEATFLVVDSRPEKLMQIRDELGLPAVEGEAIEFLCRRDPADPVWIIPAVPVHVAFRWIVARLPSQGRISVLPVPAAVDPQVPNPFRMDSITLYASFATFICPDACNEPDEICTHTREPRPGNLFETLERVRVPEFEVHVVRSWQLAPGVGGYPASQVRRLIERLRPKPGKHLVATSCRCHGVMNALSWEPQ